MQILPLTALAIAAVSQVVAASPGFEQHQAFLKQYCAACHSGKTAVGGFRLERVQTEESLRTDSQRWQALNRRVRNSEMPPKNAPSPDAKVREEFVSGVEQDLRAAVCAGGLTPGPTLLRRLNRDEYAATIRDLLDIHLDIAHNLPADGAGGEGFDNAAETLFLSPLHSEKYMETAKFALEFAAKEFKSRAKIFVAQPGKGVTSLQAARRILQNFLPRAFRSPVSDHDVASYLAVYQAARRQGLNFEGSVLVSLRAALVSPRFLFHLEQKPTSVDQVSPINDYALASRLSYFLWGSMPDELLFDLAANGQLQKPEVLKALIPRMLRNDRSLDFTRRFTEQWLRTRELSGDKAPDSKLFPTYATDEELRSDIRYQPILFFRELLVRDDSLLNLIDSDHTIITSNLVKHYGSFMQVRKASNKQPHWAELPKDSNRGGLLGMGAVLAVSSYPYRTSPVLRGAWVLDTMLGTPPPPPPPNVPALEEAHGGATAKTMRERLSQHRANAVCASCHNSIDPLGFALENYDSVGRWRDQDAGRPIDNSGQLPDGSTFQGPGELRKVLLAKKDQVIHNLTSRMLGYALGRGLTLTDSCTVDQIAEQVKENGYSAQSLIEGIVLSMPFRYQEPRKQ